MGNAPADPARFELGGCTVTLLSGGSLKLDGGAMFGLIPKALWSRTTPADDLNRIHLNCNCLLVEWAGESARRLIVETGHGPKYDAREQKIFAINPEDWLLPALEAAGVDAATVTDVVVTHLHFDHAGGLTCVRDGRLVPTFPNARVHVQRREFEDARLGFGVMTQTYREESYLPIDEVNGWSLCDGDAEVAPGVRPLLTAGHTRGHQSLIIEGRDRGMIFTGDVMPTRNHVGQPYNMAYDLFPLDNQDSKRRVLALAAERDWLLALDHDPETPIVRVVPDGEYFALETESAAPGG
ncbi:MAG: MBL fold metallo-hydrolase [Planctomycetes bacterium]|nr:MBL fold metallo-hydrolase [Planctomycetota bacterium]